MCGGRSRSSSSSTTNTNQTDRRTSADNGSIAVSIGDGNVTIDQVPEEFLEFAENTATGAFDLVEASNQQVADSLEDARADWMDYGREVNAGAAGLVSQSLTAVNSLLDRTTTGADGSVQIGGKPPNNYTPLIAAAGLLAVAYVASQR